MTTKLRIAIPIIVSISVLGAQEFLWQRVLKLPETEQTEFVKSYISEDLRKPFSAEVRERSSAISTLMSTKGDAFIPLFESTIQREMKTEAPLSNGIVYRAMGLITNAGTELVLDTIVRLFQDDNVRLRRYIPPALSSGWGGNTKPRTILKWYKALESPIPDVRAAATEIVQDVFTRELIYEYDHQALADAMETRYGHPPAESDFNTDPLIRAIEGRSMTSAYDARRKVLELSERMRRKKEHDLKKK